ncbi:transglutaminase-like domain-containing protein [Haloimpatiens lingqiaonensis]|uniref:transglutaminase-like domain-containing protein n=1 Tax=Haloimpatiens lingqiaonensis TaxID=1380675 RepID=UPI001FAA416F|nr:transglutaminase-like domain-containing protein [Haloimpatiens lingqiaonensis]
MYREFFQNFIRNINPINILLLAIFIYPILKGFIVKFSSKNLKKDVNGVETNVSFLISIILGIYWMKNIFFNHNKGIYKSIYELIPKEAKMYVMRKPIVVYLVAIPISVFIIHNLFMFIIVGINKITVYPIFDGIEKKIREKGNGIRRVLGAIFQIPRAICYVIFLTFLLNFLSIVNIKPGLNSYLADSKYYNSICKAIVIPINSSKVAKKLPNIVNNSFKIVIKDDNSPDDKKYNSSNVKNTSKTIVYYNGITLEEGIKSNEDIDNFARNLVAGYGTDEKKAQKIYNWIGKNIAYDNEKAEKVFKNIYDIKSGAIPTYYTKKGICFDYSCLYVAMCRANNIKVRMITGRGFNGVSWVGHAWNQVYLKEEGRWINVDTTFAKGGDYFDSNRFSIDHADANVAGEWQN